MGRRADHSRDELHSLALDAACRIVDDQGMDALTARGVARAIGYSPGSLYTITPTRRPVMSNPSWGQWAVWKHGPPKSSTPGKSGT